MDARRALLSRLIDHAALFPPASMSMADALAEDRRARESPESWLLARFVCPASRLHELGDEQRALTVVVDQEGDLSDERIESLELEQVGVHAGEVYVEVTLGDDLDERLDQLVDYGLRAKVRCGGASVPDAAELARFVDGCRRRELVFKATAGLHHAYPTAGEHGFLNLLAAAVFADEEDALAAAPGSFELDEDSFRWGSRRAGSTVLAQTRGTLFHSVGSCSFFEPVDELRALGML